MPKYPCGGENIFFFVSENVGNVTKGKNDLNPNIGSNWQYW